MKTQSGNKRKPKPFFCILKERERLTKLVPSYQKSYLRHLNVIKSLYVKFERKIPGLVEDFCRYYAKHRNKTVVYKMYNFIIN